MTINICFDGLIHRVLPNSTIIPKVSEAIFFKDLNVAYKVLDVIYLFDSNNNLLEVNVNCEIYDVD